MRNEGLSDRGVFRIAGQAKSAKGVDQDQCVVGIDGIFKSFAPDIDERLGSIRLGLNLVQGPRRGGPSLLVEVLVGKHRLKGAWWRVWILEDGQAEGCVVDHFFAL